MKHLINKVFLLVAVFCISVCSAQDFSNRGKDFWLPYPDHIDGTTSRMALYISSDVSTTGVVNLAGTSIPFTVTANQAISIPIYPSTYNVINQQTQGINTNKAINIVSQAPVVVFVHVLNAARSASTLLLPTHTLGKKYHTVSYSQNPSSYTSKQVSQFQIVGVENNTDVLITPTQTDIGNTKAANVPFQITLNKGDVYQFQSLNDITGSKIESISSGTGTCKPIAVFSGSTFTRISPTGDNCGSTGDNLFQQLFPVASWGKNYITAPLTRSFTAPNRLSDIFRIIVDDPATSVTLNGSVINPATLINGSYYEIKNSTPNEITSDKPISVVQFMTTQGCGFSTNGDPEMTILNPIEQNIKDITVVSARNDLTPPNTNITAHYLNIIIHANAAASLRIDNNIPTGTFIPIPNTNYVYLQENVTTSTLISPSHRIYADSGFLAIAYGVGTVESYAYNAGTNVVDLYQFVSIENEYAIVNFPATCKGTPFKFSMTFPYQPTQITWKFNGLFQDTTLMSPGFDSSWVVNNRTIYKYSLSKIYTVTTIGTYSIKVEALNPTADGCSGLQEINYDLQVFDAPIADFSFVTTGCVTDQVSFTDKSIGFGRPTYRWLWNFDEGNGFQFNAKNPNYTFTSPGLKKVALKAITDIGCVTDSISKDVVVTNVPTADYQINSTICENKAITFSDSSKTNGNTMNSNLVKWIWNFGGGDVRTLTGFTPDVYKTYNPVGAYPITYQVENAAGCLSPVKIATINVNHNPVSDFSLPNVCLPAGTAQFNNQTVISSGTMSYAWDFGNSTSAGNVLNPIATYTATGPYTVKLTTTSNMGCTHDTTKVLGTIYNQPQADFSAPVEVCLSDSAVYKDLSNAPNSTVTEWLWDFGDGTNSTLQNPPPKYYAAPNTYTVTLSVKSAIGCPSTIASKQIVINPLPAPQFSIVTPSCEKQQVGFIDASVPNVGNITTWNWDFRDGDTKSYANGNPFNKTYDTAGNYNVLLEVITDKGCRKTLTKDIRVNTLPRPDFIKPKVCLDDAFAFFNNTTTIADGTTASLMYEWNFGDPNSIPANNVSTLKDPSHKYSQLGVYTTSLKVTSVDGCVKDTAISFTVNGSTPVADFNVLNAAGLCGNTLTSIQNTSTVAFGIITDVVIKWDLLGAPMMDSIDGNPTLNKVYFTKYPDFQNPLSKNYTVRMYSYSGSSCVDSIQKVVSINASPKVAMLTIPGICNEANPRLTTQGSETGGVPGTFMYRGTSISPSGSFDPRTLTPANYDIEYVFTSNKGCRDSITKPITVWPSPTAKWDNSALNCEKNAITFMDSSVANYSNIVLWKWDFGAGGPAAANQTTANPFTKTFNAYGTYNVGLQVFTDSGCQSVVTSKLLQIHPLPRVDFKIPEICLPAGRGQFMDQSSIPVGTSSAFRFNWDFGDGGPGSVLKDPYYTYSNVGPYSVKLIVTSEFNCIDSTSKLNTTIYPQPKANFSVDKSEVCLGGTFTFTDQSDGKTSLVNSWNWKLGDNTTASIPNPTKNYSTDGSYNVSLFVFNQQGCVSDTMIKMVTVHPYPTVDAGKDLFVLEGGQTTFNPKVSGNDLKFAWSPQLYLDNYTLQNPVCKPLDDITYIITVTGRGECSVQDDLFVKVLKAPKIPNAFSPNGDGINDRWEIEYLESYPGATVEIFNRYGQLLFRSVGYDRPWDGSYQGKQVPAGTYYYIVDPKNGRKQIAGFVDILR